MATHPLPAQRAPGAPAPAPASAAPAAPAAHPFGLRQFVGVLGVFVAAMMSGLNSRMGGGWETFDQIVQLDGNGQYTLLDPASPQLVLIPVVLDTNGIAAWPNGSSQVKIVGFAWFVITGCGNPSQPGACKNSDGKYVNGTFVGLMDNSLTGSTGAWQPTTTTATTYELTQ